MAKRKTKEQFIRAQRRKGRTRAQAETTWKMMRGAKERFRDYYALNVGKKKRKNLLYVREGPGGIAVRPNATSLQNRVRDYNTSRYGFDSPRLSLNRKRSDAFIRKFLTASERKAVARGERVPVKVDADEFSQWVGLDRIVLHNPKAKRILITYEIVTHESAEHGDAEERGWIDEEGDVIELDEFDREEGITVVDKTVAYLDRAYATEPSESGRDAAPRWWTDYDHDGDPATGARTNKSYHLEGYTEAEKRQIYRVMKQLHSWVP